jgi:penicillin amidase
MIGATEPAIPGVAIGHNDRIAFGLTVVGMDQLDVYVEALGPCGGQSLGCYRHQNAWIPVRTIVDTIRVKGEAPQVAQLQFTVHGPIVSVDTARSRAIAIRSVHSEPGTAAYLASLSLNRARNWGEFQEAMTRWLMPSENMIYADVDGNIGWVAGGIMPRRRWSGLLPVPGDGRYEWDGFVPGMALPRGYNPKAGFIATSNHNILPSGYTIPLSHEWAPRYRIDRVKEVLSVPGARFSVADFERLQHDDLSKLAQSLVPRLVAAAGRRGGMRSEEAGILASWNHRMSRDQVAPTLFAAWAPAAYRRAIARVLGGEREAAQLLATRPEYEWLEQYLAGPQSAVPATDSLLIAALEDAVADLTRRFGSDRKKWRWGDVHVAVFRHRLSPKYDLPPVGRSGDGNTVNATGGVNYRQGAGASFREIIDLGDFDNSVVTNVPGQSADPTSQHYSDLLALWGNDRYFPLVYSRARVEAETREVLWLRPERR